MHPSPPTLALPGAARTLSVLPFLMLLIVLLGLVLLSVAPLPAVAQDGNAKPVYRCPGPPVLYTDALSAAEAGERGCRTIEGAPVTVVQTRPATPATASAPAAARPADSRVDPAAQRARDSDARRILADELAREEGRLAQLQREFNGGEPERRGDERNYQRYLDRVAEMRVGITRKESDIAALKRELAKLPQ
jgi:hypothetical protein